MSHRSRFPSAVRTNAPFRVPTSRRTPLITALLPYCRSAPASIDTPVSRANSSAPLFGFCPSRANRLERDLAAPLGTERPGAGSSTFETAKTPERGGGRISHGQRHAPPQDAQAFGRRMARRARCADHLGLFRLIHLPFPVADEAAPQHPEDDVLT